MMQSDLQNRLVYRGTPGVIRFAWRIVILSILMTALVFILIPLSSKLGKLEDEVVVIRKVPALVELDKPEEVFEEPEPLPQNEPEVREMEVPVVPPIPPPPALSVKLEISAKPSSVKLHVDKNFKTDFSFEVEKITAAAEKNLQPPEKISSLAPSKVSLPAIDYNGIFNENQVDQKARRTRYVAPGYPMRARRRNISGRVVISCTITKEGKVANPKIIEARPQGYFESNCLSVLPKLVYEAAVKDGQKVAQRTILTFEFGLRR